MKMQPEKKINEKVYIALYNQGKSTMELSILFDVPERTLQRLEQRLRLEGKLKYRATAPITKTVSKIYPEEFVSIDWTIKKSNIPATKPVRYTSYLVSADYHIPFINKPVVNGFLKMMDDNKFDGFILLGDYMDMTGISHWLQNKKMSLENKRLKEDYIEGNKLLDEFDKRLPKNCDKRYFHGNHCLDMDTQVLTNRGWKNYDSLEDNDKVLSLNKEDSTSTWCTISHKFKYKFDGWLNQIKSSHIDFLGTDDHNMFYTNRDKIKYRHKMIKDLVINCNYYIPVATKNIQKDYPISDEWIKLVAWILTDGHIKNNKYKYIQLYQRESKLFLITDILDKLKLEYSVIKRKRDDITQICGKLLKSKEIQCDINIKAHSSRIIHKYISSKDKIPEYISKLSKRQFDIFINSIIDGDGSRHRSAPKTSMMVYGLKDFCEELSLLCIQNEYRTSISEYRKGDYRLNLCSRAFLNWCNHPKAIKKVKYEGYVWDLTIEPNHNFLVRRNGKIYFTGNCDWSNQLLEEYPALEGFIEPITQLKLKERGYKVYEDLNHIEKIGRLAFTHGIYSCQNYVKKHIDELKTNIMFGHLHSEATMYESSPAKELAIAGYAISCMCDLNPDYLKNKPNRWTHGFAVVHFYEDGFFDVDMKRIVNGKFVYNNKFYDGNI